MTGELRCQFLVHADAILQVAITSANNLGTATEDSGLALGAWR